MQVISLQINGFKKEIASQEPLHSNRYLLPIHFLPEAK